MGMIGHLLSFFRRTENGKLLDEAKVDTGGSSKTVQHYADPGDDSQPLPGDFPLLVESGGKGEAGAAGWHDTKTPRKAGPGEKRVYARSAAGTASCEIWLKSTGEVRIEVFTDAPIFLKSPGQVVIDSPDIRVGDEGASQPIARVGDLITGSLAALAPQGSPGVPVPLLPVPGKSSLSASGGITFAGQIVSGASKAKA